jgi:hypothetical protein
MVRTELSRGAIDLAVADIVEKLSERLHEKGYGSFSSIHEIRGVIDEEYNELREAMHKKDHAAIADELLDIVVGALFGYACIKGGSLDW